MDQLVSFVHENWFVLSSTQLAAFGLWRAELGASVRRRQRPRRPHRPAISHSLMCGREGRLLPGTKIVPERIRENREPYYAALQAADRAWEEGNYDLSAMEGYLAGLLADRLCDTTEAGKRRLEGTARNSLLILRTSARFRSVTRLSASISVVARTWRGSKARSQSPGC